MNNPVKYWIYFISEIDLENEIAPNDPEMIRNPFYRIDDQCQNVM